MVATQNPPKLMHFWLHILAPPLHVFFGLSSIDSTKPPGQDPMMVHESPIKIAKIHPKKNCGQSSFFAVCFCSSAAPHPRHHGPELRPPQRHGGPCHGGHRLPRDLRAPCRDGHDVDVVADRDAGRRGSSGWPGDAEEEPQQGAEWGFGEETGGKWMDLDGFGEGDGILYIFLYCIQ